MWSIPRRSQQVIRKEIEQRRKHLKGVKGVNKMHFTPYKEVLKVF